MPQGKNPFSVGDRPSTFDDPRRSRLLRPEDYRPVPGEPPEERSPERLRKALGMS